jgi:hypothetical protein
MNSSDPLVTRTPSLLRDSGANDFPAASKPTRRAFGLAAVGAAVCSSIPGAAWAEDPREAPQSALNAPNQAAGMADMAPMSEEMQKCVALCVACHSSCVKAINHCLEAGGKNAAPEHIRLLLDCAALCEESATFMLRGSTLHGRICGVCAEACNMCAKSCEGVGKNGQLKACVSACRSCADSCRHMSGT